MARYPDIRTLQAFITTANAGSVSAAALQLHLTQPAVSLQLKRLSQDTGLTLFERSSNGLTLTPEGRALLGKAERVLLSLAEFAQTAQRLSGQLRGTLRIGTIVDPDFIRLGQLLATLREAYPELQTQLTHGISGEVLHQLKQDQIDVGFFLSFAQSKQADTELVGDTHEAGVFECLALTEFNYRIIAPAGWQAELEQATWPELAALPWIGTPADSVHSRLLSKVMSEHRCQQHLVALVDQEPSMIAMVRSGIGLCLCRESIALYEHQASGLSMAKHIKLPASLNVVTLKRRLNEPMIQEFFQVLRGIWTAVESPATRTRQSSLHAN